MRSGRVAAGLLVMLAGLLVLPAIGHAAGFQLAIEKATLDLGDVKNVKALDATDANPDPPATLKGTIQGRQVAISRSGFYFPTKTTEVTKGIDATISLAANKEITGQYDAASGELTLAFSLKATVELLGQRCVISPIKSSLSTRYGLPWLGVPFSGGLAGAGALSGHWNDLPEPVGPTACQIVGQLTVGPGGIWMARGLAEPAKCEADPTHPGCDESNPCANGPSSQCCAAQPQFAPCREGGKPKLGLKVTPSAKRVRRGGKVTLVAKVKNSGSAKAAGVRVCLQAPKGTCTSGAVAAGKTTTRRLKLKLKPSIRGTYTVKVKLTAPGLPAKTAKVKLKVRS